MDERLRREEPPLNSDDTSPSIVSRAALSGPSRPASSRGQRILGALMLLMALVLTLAATILWMTGDGEPVRETDRATAARMLGLIQEQLQL